MVETFRSKIAKTIAPSIFDEARRREADVVKKERNIQREVDQRVAAVLSKMDPFLPLMREFNGIFSEEYEHPEENLNDAGRLNMITWAWQTREHPAFKHLMAWIMNTQANETLKRAPVTPERIMYGRAQIAGMVLLRREINRLGQLYDDELAKKRGEDFDEHAAAE